VRMAGFLLSAAVLGLVVGTFVELTRDAERLRAASPWRYAVLLVAAGAAVLVLCRCLPGPRPRTDLAWAPLPESTFRLCGVGIAAWLPVLLMFVMAHFQLPDWVYSTLGIPLFFSIVLGPFFLLFTIGIGILAVGRAKSRGAKWIVALVHLSAPMGYAAWWFSSP